MMSSNSSGFDVARIREDFPILDQMINGKPLVYMDNAATTQKPQPVIDALVSYYSNDNSNVHRGVHTLSQRATDLYEEARSKVRILLNAASDKEVVFVRGTTEGINLIAQTFVRNSIGPDDEIVISAMEHHSNIVPWQILCQERGAHLKVAPINDDGELLLDEFEALLGTKTKLVSIVHQSNALGSINPAGQIVALAHSYGIPVLLDGAQSIQHLKVDVRELDCDFYVFSGHKLYGPTGIGVLYGKEEYLEQMPPYQAGGEMIKSVTYERTIYNDLPAKFEAGTPNIAGAVGLGAAIDYITNIGMDRIYAHEQDLLTYGTECLSGIGGLRMIGTAEEKASVMSFIMDSAHPHDIGTILDTEGVAIRTGHHCAQPLMDRFGIPATARASLAFYNTKDEIDLLVKAIDRVNEVFS